MESDADRCRNLQRRQMKKIIVKIFLLTASVAVLAFAASAQTAEKLSAFGAVGSEYEMLNLDALEVSLQNQPTAEAYILIYAGRKSKSNETAAAIKRIRRYLVERRRADTNRLKFVDGGRKEKPWRELWIVSEGATPPTPAPTIKTSKVPPPPRHR